MMGKEREVDADVRVLDVIVDLIRVALPSEFHAAALELAARVVEHPEVAPHVLKTWGRLSQREVNVIAREVGLVARDVVVGAGDTSDSGEHLH
jgi:hypothetical protein